MNRNLLKTLGALWLLFVLFAATTAWAQPRIYRNNIEGTNPSAQNPLTTGEIKNANITASGLFRSAGLTASVAQESFRATGWNSSTLNTADYFEWTITPNEGYELDFLELNINQSYEGGQKATALKSSLDGFTATIAETTNNFWSLSAAQYQNVTTPITFRFYVWNASSANNQFGIDFFNFNGTVSATMSAPGFEMASLKYYPNPVKDILNLSHTADITGIAVYNVLGQQVLSRNINAAEATLDMSRLNAGNYIVKVISDSGTKTIKIVKQ